MEMGKVYQAEEVVSGEGYSVVGYATENRLCSMWPCPEWIDLDWPWNQLTDIEELFKGD